LLLLSYYHNNHHIDGTSLSLFSNQYNVIFPYYFWLLNIFFAISFSCFSSLSSKREKPIQMMINISIGINYLFKEYASSETSVFRIWQCEYPASIASLIILCLLCFVIEKRIMQRLNNVTLTVYHYYIIKQIYYILFLPYYTPFLIYKPFLLLYDILYIVYNI
jgi:hypothetical protein